MKKIISIIVVLVFAIALFAGCGTQETADPTTASTSETNETEELQHITISGIDGALPMLPVWIANEKGWLEEAGIEVEILGFVGGPVQMESMASWDLGITGVGGVLAGVLGHDAILLGTAATDVASQNFYAAADSAIVQAGQGNNTISDTVYGDAEAWKNAEILSAYGDVKHYELIKTLQGFGLTVDDCNILWMDASACLTSFLTGQGDAVAVYGAKNYGEEVEGLVQVINGRDVDLGLMANILANPDSYKDDAMRETMKDFLRVYFETIEWITNNTDESINYYIEYNQYVGRDVTENVATHVVTGDTYYSLEDNYNTMTTKSEDGDYNLIQEKIVNVLNFFISVESYQQGDVETFLADGHCDSSLIEELYNETN